MNLEAFGVDFASFLWTLLEVAKWWTGKKIQEGHWWEQWEAAEDQPPLLFILTFDLAFSSSGVWIEDQHGRFFCSAYYVSSVDLLCVRHCSGCLRYTDEEGSQKEVMNNGCSIRLWLSPQDKPQHQSGQHFPPVQRASREHTARSSALLAHPGAQTAPGPSVLCKYLLNI